MTDWNKPTKDNDIDFFNYRKLELVYHYGIDLHIYDWSRSLENLEFESNAEPSEDIISNYFDLLFGEIKDQDDIDVFNRACIDLNSWLRNEMSISSNVDYINYLKRLQSILDKKLDKFEVPFRSTNQKLIEELHSKLGASFNQFILLFKGNVYYVNKRRNLYKWYLHQVKTISPDFKASYNEYILYSIELAKDILNRELLAPHIYPQKMEHYYDCKRELTIAQYLISSQLAHLVNSENEIEYDSSHNSFSWVGSPDELRTLFDILRSDYNGGVMNSNVSFDQFKRIFDYKDLNELNKRKINWESPRGEKGMQIYDLRFLFDELMIRGKLKPNQSKSILKILPFCFTYDGNYIDKTPKAKEAKELKTLLDKHLIVKQFGK